MTNNQVSWHAAKQHRWKVALPVFTVGIVLALSGCADNSQTGTGDQEDTAGTVLASADLADVEDSSVGVVSFTEQEDSMDVSVTIEDMEPGFYGLHIHQVGSCEADSAAPDDATDIGDFKSAGGHLSGKENAKHPDHAGDLPALLVNEDGTATMTVTTDRLDESMVLDEDGSSVMIHAEPDNFANIPERYASDGPDQDTTDAGDSGDRLACGVLQD